MSARAAVRTAPRPAAPSATRSTPSSARAPRRVERQRPPRPQLRVAHAERVRRVRRVRPAAVLMVLATAGIVFGALSIQISLIHRQQQLDAIRQRVSDIQAQNKELRQRESRLQAPAEILRIARDDLGMVESKPAELVTPEQQTVGPAKER